MFAPVADLSTEMAQIVDVVGVGVCVVDSALRVFLWNRWMEEHSGLPRDQVIGKHLHEVFPDLNLAELRRKIRQVLTLGNVAFFDAKLHGYLFPFRNQEQLGRRFEHMQQSCTVAPLKSQSGRLEYVCITVSDETGSVTADSALREANAQLEHASQRDPLTDLYHRGYVCDRLDFEIKRLKRHPASLSVLLLDVDWFKTINDAWGHLAGDEILRRISKTLVACVRETDLVGRYGGEEFIVVMPETAENQLYQVAERVRIGIADMGLVWNEYEIRVTASVGGAESREPHEVNAVLARADAALYEAKATGRNRTVIAS